MTVPDPKPGHSPDQPPAPPTDLHLAERPIEDAQAARHASARAGRASAVLEDYVELIDDLLREDGEARPTDLARRLGVAHATAIKSIARLKALGLAHSRPYRGVFLTEDGHALARKVRARHRVVVDLLTAVGVPPDVAESDAEGLEHHVSDATLEAFAEFLRRR
jgi:DtxR family manganese transport transcriptional regulator